MRAFTRVRDADTSPVTKERIIWARTKLYHTGAWIADTLNGTGDYLGNKLFNFAAIMHEELIFANYG